MDARPVQDGGSAGEADFFEAAFGAATSGLARLRGPDLALDLANAALLAQLETSLDALRGRTLDALFQVSPADRNSARGSPAAVVLRWRTDTGSHLRLHAALTYLADGDAILAVRNARPAGRTSDAIDHHRGEMGLALDAAGLGYWNWDKASDRVDLSERAAGILAVPVGALPTWAELGGLIEPDDASRAGAAFADAVAGERPYVVEYRLRRRPGVPDTWISARGHAVHDAEGGLLGMIGTVQDITAREEARRALHDREQRLRVATTVADLGIFEWYVLEDRALWENERMWQIFGRRPQEGTVGKAELFGSIMHLDDVAAFRAAVLTAVRGDGILHATCRIRRGTDGAWRTIEMAGRFQREASESIPNRLIGVVADITDRHLAEERQSLLIRELHHRVKNTLATVQAIVGSTARTASSIESFYEAFVGRIKSLAHTHSVLTEDTWQTASLRSLLENELTAYADGSMRASATARVSLDGPPVDLASEIAVPIGMAIHELTTNAAKYGALSNRSGRVSVSWTVRHEGETAILDFAWRESGGPPVAQPSRQGFGSRLLQRVLTAQVQATIEATYDPGGFALAMRAPLPKRNAALNPLV